MLGIQCDPIGITNLYNGSLHLPPCSKVNSADRGCSVKLRLSGYRRIIIDDYSHCSVMHTAPD